MTVAAKEEAVTSAGNAGARLHGMKDQGVRKHAQKA